MDGVKGAEAAALLPLSLVRTARPSPSATPATAPAGQPSRTTPSSPGAAPAIAPTGHSPAPPQLRERRHGHLPAPLRPRDRRHGHPPAPLRPGGRQHGHPPAPQGRTAITNTTGTRTCNKKRTRTKECEKRHRARERTNPSGGLPPATLRPQRRRDDHPPALLRPQHRGHANQGRHAHPPAPLRPREQKSSHLQAPRLSPSGTGRDGHPPAPHETQEHGTSISWLQA